MKYYITCSALWYCKRLKMFAIINKNSKGVFVDDRSKKVVPAESRSWADCRRNLTIIVVK